MWIAALDPSRCLKEKKTQGTVLKIPIVFVCERDPIQSTSGAQHAAVTAEGRIAQASLQGRVSRTTSAQPCVDRHLVQENQYVKILLANLNDLPLFYTWSGTIEGNVSAGQQLISTTGRHFAARNFLYLNKTNSRRQVRMQIWYKNLMMLLLLACLWNKIRRSIESDVWV